ITPNAFQLLGSVEAGGMESFEFTFETRGFIPGGFEELRIQAASVTLGGGTGIAEGPVDLGNGNTLPLNGTFPLGANATASGRVLVLATDTGGEIVVSNAAEVLSRLDDSEIVLQADFVDVLGAFHAGVERSQSVLLSRGERAAIRIHGGSMVTFGGTSPATDFDVAQGFASAVGVETARFGTAFATGAIAINVAGGTPAIFVLQEGSSLTTDASAVPTPSLGAASTIDVRAAGGLQVFGVIQAKDDDSDVTLISGDGLLEVHGYVEAGDELTLTGATQVYAAVARDILPITGQLSASVTLAIVLDGLGPQFQTEVVLGAGTSFANLPAALNAVLAATDMTNASVPIGMKANAFLRASLGNDG
ncbi:MAG: hypothetical protein WD176_03085, partial [Pirellulales bacterium]